MSHRDNFLHSAPFHFHIYRQEMNYTNAEYKTVLVSLFSISLRFHILHTHTDTQAFLSFCEHSYCFDRPVAADLTRSSQPVSPFDTRPNSLRHVHTDAQCKKSHLLVMSHFTCLTPCFSRAIFPSVICGSFRAVVHTGRSYISAHWEPTVLISVSTLHWRNISCSWPRWKIFPKSLDDKEKNK